MSTRLQKQSVPEPAPRAATLPRVITTRAQIREAVLNARVDGRTVGFVPTMGALHEGHLTLVDAARAECNLVVASVFVNPTQFAPHEDYQKYPRDLDRDLKLLGARGCEVVFAPSVEEMYPAGHGTSIDVGAVAQPFEGEVRPSHFQGVATVVMKLFQLVPANRAYFGQKDYQQTLVVRQMVADLNVPIEVRVCPTVREPDGLAMSSRNAYLSPDERRQALMIPHSLRLAESLVAAGVRDVAAIRAQMAALIEQVSGVTIEYITLVADGTVTPVTEILGPTIIAIAAKVGRTRLIDNARVG